MKRIPKQHPWKLLERELHDSTTLPLVYSYTLENYTVSIRLRKETIWVWQATSDKELKPLWSIMRRALSGAVVDDQFSEVVEIIQAAHKKIPKKELCKYYFDSESARRVQKERLGQAEYCKVLMGQIRAILEKDDWKSRRDQIVAILDDPNLS